MESSHIADEIPPRSGEKIIAQGIASSLGTRKEMGPRLRDLSSTLHRPLPHILLKSIVLQQSCHKAF